MRAENPVRDRFQQPSKKPGEAAPYHPWMVRHEVKVDDCSWLVPELRSDGDGRLLPLRMGQFE